jgi:hypothetical protein
MKFSAHIASIYDFVEEVEDDAHADASSYGEDERTHV